MPQSFRRPAKPTLHVLKLSLAGPDYRVFVIATRKLRRIMGSRAPDTAALIVFNLSGRDATGLADHYLETHRWPVTARETIALRRPADHSRN